MLILTDPAVLLKINELLPPAEGKNHAREKLALLKKMIDMKNNNPFSRRGFLIGLFILFAVFACPSEGKAQVTPRMVDVLITGNTRNVLLYARVVDCFKPEMVSATMAGVPVVFTLHLDVYQERHRLWNKHIAGKEIQRTIKYDNLKKTFTVTTDGISQPMVFQDFESARKAMADFDGIAVVPFSRLSRGNNYYVLMKVKIDRVSLPFNMEYVLFFVSLWDFETPLYRLRFSY